MQTAFVVLEAVVRSWGKKGWKRCDVIDRAVQAAWGMVALVCVGSVGCATAVSEEDPRGGPLDSGPPRVDASAGPTDGSVADSVGPGDARVDTALDTGTPTDVDGAGPEDALGDVDAIEYPDTIKDDSDASPPDATPADACGSCASTDLCCSGACIAPSVTNCGTCGRACSLKSADGCSAAGGCTCGAGAECSGAGSCCSGACTDVSSDPKSCGSCGRVCFGDQLCRSSTCVCDPAKPATSCPAKSRCCGTDGACDDICFDMNNCGGCGIKCTGSPGICFYGRCWETVGSKPPKLPECT